MMLFTLPPLLTGPHKILIWGLEKSWSQNGKWDHGPIAWHFEKALHETLFDRDSTKLLPATARSAFAGDVLVSIKKSIMTLKKIYSREVELFCLARLQGETATFIEGYAPAWMSLLQITAHSQNAQLHSCHQDEWFSYPLTVSSTFYLVRPDLIECPHHLETSEATVCRYEPLAEWLASHHPSAIGFSPEEFE